MIIRRASVKICGARCRSRVGRCRNRVPPGWKRCKYHGGASTGPRTEAGKARARASLPALQEGHRRWRANMNALRAAGLIEKFPCGRKAGAAWITPRMRARALGLADDGALRRIVAADVGTPEGRAILDANRGDAASALDELERTLLGLSS